MVILTTFFTAVLLLTILAVIGVGIFYAVVFIAEVIPGPVWFIIFALAALTTYGVIYAK